MTTHFQEHDDVLMSQFATKSYFYDDSCYDYPYM